MPILVTQDASVAGDPKDFGRYLAWCRKRRKLRMRAAAELAGISVAYLEQLEYGTKREPSLTVLVALGRVYGIGVRLLLTAWLAGQDGKASTDSRYTRKNRTKVARKGRKF
jgi:transcriptional regulator with XRE-family HTH domain